MITVVPLLKTKASLIIRNTVLFGKCKNSISEVIMKFTFGYTTKIVIILQQRYIIQIIKVAEYTYLAELGNTGEKGKTKITVTALKHTVKSLQGISIFGHKSIISYSLKHRFVIFIYKHHHITSCLLCSTLYNVCKTFLRCTVLFLVTIFLFPFFQILV